MAYDDTRLTYVNDIDGQNLDNNRLINRNYVTVRQVSRTRKTGDSVPRAGGAPTPTTGLPFGSRLQAPPNRGGGIEQLSLLLLRQAMQCYSLTQHIGGSDSEL